MYLLISYPSLSEKIDQEGYFENKFWKKNFTIDFFGTQNYDTSLKDVKRCHVCKNVLLIFQYLFTYGKIKY